MALTKTAKVPSPIRNPPPCLRFLSLCEPATGEADHAGSDLRKVVVDRGVTVPDGLVVGEDPEFDAKWFRRTDEGVTLVTQAMIDKYVASR